MAGVLCPDCDGLTSLQMAITLAEERVASVEGVLQSASAAAGSHTGDAEPLAQRPCNTYTRDTSCPEARVLSTPHLCEHMLSYVGVGEWAFIAAISKTMKAAYTVATITAARAYAERYSFQELQPALFRTECAATVTSASRLEYALASRLAESAKEDDSGMLLSYSVCIAAGATGDMRVITRAHEAGMPIDEDVLLGAASTADVGVLAELQRRLAQAGEGVTTATWLDVGVSALKGDPHGCAETLSWLSQLPRHRDISPSQCWTWPEWYVLALCCTAIKCGKIATLMWLLSKGAAVFGQQAFRDDGTPALATLASFEDESDILDAVLTTIAGDLKGQVHTLLDQAVGHGCRAVVEHLGSLPGTPYKFTRYTLASAARCGHVPLLQWLHKQGAPVHVYRIAHAAMHSENALPVLEWLSNSRMLTGSLLSGDVGVPLLLKALKRLRLDAAAWLLRQGAQWKGDLGECAANRSLPAPAVVWAAEHNLRWGRWTDASCEQIRRHGASALAKLHQLGAPCACPKEVAAEGENS
ncbi:hypothetical protein JKP88DRAFT_263387 [Tribonema minus]|uniref:Ankyrin repeat protein n=1 Tax=Tribonema minus TaxID=303371 RepID=A0A836CFM9_9STRA|nr:hypothetical protein JKP88DRAFT_263387 [Tribonema minus]